MKIHNLLSSIFAFFQQAWASAGELRSIARFCQLIKFSKHLHERAQPAIPVNARIERHLKIQIDYFGYYQISLNTAKVIILANIFLQMRKVNTIGQ